MRCQVNFPKGSLSDKAVRFVALQVGREWLALLENYCVLLLNLLGAYVLSRDYTLALADH